LRNGQKCWRCVKYLMQNIDENIRHEFTNANLSFQLYRQTELWIACRTRSNKIWYCSNMVSCFFSTLGRRRAFLMRIYLISWQLIFLYSIRFIMFYKLRSISSIIALNVLYHKIQQFMGTVIQIFCHGHQILSLCPLPKTYCCQNHHHF